MTNTILIRSLNWWIVHFVLSLHWWSFIWKWTFLILIFFLIPPFLFFFTTLLLFTWFAFSLGIIVFHYIWLWYYCSWDLWLLLNFRGLNDWLLRCLNDCWFNGDWMGRLQKVTLSWFVFLFCIILLKSRSCWSMHAHLSVWAGRRIKFWSVVTDRERMLVAACHGI